jgi:hypothetical protein
MREGYIYIQCGIEMKCMKKYYDNMLKEVNTAVHCPDIKNGDGLQIPVASMPDVQALGKWELHTGEDLRWNGNHQPSIKYWSGDIIKCMRWLMPEPANTKHHIYAPEHCFNSNTPQNCLYTEMHSGDWWWEIQVRSDTQG